MSGLIPDLASWALRGGVGNNEADDGNGDGNGDGNDNANEDTYNSNPPAVALTEQEMRERRLARMAGNASAAAPEGATPMDIDTASANAIATPVKETTTSPVKKPSPVKKTPEKKAAVEQPLRKRKKESKMGTPSDSAKKTQRKKELLIKKILSVTLSTEDSSCVKIELDDKDNIGAHSVAEILATRLSLPPLEIRTLPSQKPLLQYLGLAHRKAGDELKTLRQASGKKDTTELQEIPQEIQRQVVSYAASSLMEPDLFEQAKDGVQQLANALMNSTLDPTTSITFGVSGATTSFYYCLCEELFTQDKATLDRVVTAVATQILAKLQRCDSIESGIGESSAHSLVASLTALCHHKKAALAIANMESFLVPPAGSPAAAEQIRPAAPDGADLLRMLTGEHRPYLKRSGPAVEKQTLLGACLKVSTPKNNPAFSPTSILRQTLDGVERSTNQQRRQLRNYQEACNGFIMGLIKGGPEARERVLSWFTDCFLLNTGATAMRPDATKVASSNMLLNTSVVLLKLCDPFVRDEKKHKLIDPGFVPSPQHNGGIFPTTGDDFLPRLGETSDEDTPMAEYSPKNTFVPQCFFLTARSLALGIVPMLSHHENLLRHISHLHWELGSQNRDVQSDPHFCIMVSKQRSGEVALFQDEMVTDTLNFLDLMAKLLTEMPDSLLKQMPEHFADNICDALESVAKMKPKALRGLELRHVFKMVVKLLSARYATMVRNYNLRATLGDVLYEIFLPSGNDDRRDVPTSVACDPMAGGQTYLLSDKSAQESLAPSLLLLYGEVEHTGYYDKMSHRAKISSLLKYLWESAEHRPAFRSITQNKESFIKFANGIINETNTLIATVMQKLPEIRMAQEQQGNPTEWARLTEEQQNDVTSRLEDNEREVKHALPLCNKTLQMFGYLNTDKDIRGLFLLDGLCPRLVNMLIHVLGKLVGSKGLELRVKNPEQYEFRPKEMLRDLCAIFALFTSSEEFQVECAKSGCNPELLRSAIKTCKKLNLLTGESMTAFESLPDLVDKASKVVQAEEALLADAPNEFMDELMATYMTDPVILPSGHYVDRSTITQHLLNDQMDPFSRKEMTVDDIKPATELKERMAKWLEEKRASSMSDN
ncbi:MAG: hypothetical protein SGBAC_009136 [Bacillariaceae sp.]